MLDKIYDFWGIKSEHIQGDVFTGYEGLYDDFDQFTKADYDLDPTGTIESVLNLYRSVNLVPIVYYTQSGITDAIKQFRKKSHNNVKFHKIGLGNNQGQTINRFLFPNMQTAEPGSWIQQSQRQIFPR